jgi:phosphate/sulfate permease
MSENSREPNNNHAIGKKSTILIVISWGFIIFSFFCLFGSLNNEKLVNNFAELLKNPISHASAILGGTVGLNMFAIVPLLIGIFIFKKRKNTKGVPIILTSSILIFFLTSYIFYKALKTGG